MRANEQFALFFLKAFAVDRLEWTKSAVVYELNTRQFSIEGTFREVQAQLLRLKWLGVDIIWMMPIYPIGAENRKGSLGSYYSVRDYKSVNPEFGTFDDFKSLVAEAHKFGLHVIIDWVGNHTSRDAVWVTEHPDWYKWENGSIVAPYDWSDVAQLDVWNRQMWQGMVEAMSFWLTEADIDGFRCDMASLLPLEFWEYVRTEINKIKPVFMLAESEDSKLSEYAFDATYCWELLHLMNNLSQQRKSLDDLVAYFTRSRVMFNPRDMRLAFTSNHDENSWNGSEFERMGLAARQMAALTYVIPSIPLIYNGQEVAFSGRLKFFDKDEIEWEVNLDFTQFYQKLNRMKKAHPALWNAELGGSFNYFIDKPNVLRIERKLGDDIVVGIFNFSPLLQSVRIPEYATEDCLSETVYAANREMNIDGWQFLLLSC